MNVLFRIDSGADFRDKFGEKTSVKAKKNIRNISLIQGKQN